MILPFFDAFKVLKLFIQSCSKVNRQHGVFSEKWPLSHHPYSLSAWEMLSKSATGQDSHNIRLRLERPQLP